MLGLPRLNMKTKTYKAYLLWSTTMIMFSPLILAIKDVNQHLLYGHSFIILKKIDKVICMETEEYFVRFYLSSNELLLQINIYVDIITSYIIFIIFKKMLSVAIVTNQIKKENSKLKVNLTFTCVIVNYFNIYYLFLWPTH